MKKLSAVFIIIFLITNISCVSVSAQEQTFDYSGVYNSLSDEAAGYLQSLGVSAADPRALSNLSFEGVMAQLSQMAGQSMDAPLRGLVSVVAVLILCSMLTAYKSSLSNDVGETVQTAAALCISLAVAAPAVSFIQSAGGVITNCANLFLAYIPVVSVMMATSGRAISALTYQGSMIAAGQGVARVSSDVILPFLNLFLGVSITSGVAPQVRLGGLCALTARFTKWLLAFVMSIFTAVLSVRQVASNALDTVASRTAKFALSSFVPVVGGALSEAYRTVQGSLHVLKSGLGIFVILALAVTFLPIVLQGLGWALCLMAGKTLAEVMGLEGCAALLEALRMVFSTLIAVLLCVMAVFIISTAVAFTIGGDGA